MFKGERNELVRRPIRIQATTSYEPTGRERPYDFPSISESKIEDFFALSQTPLAVDRSSLSLILQARFETLVKQRPNDETWDTEFEVARYKNAIAFIQNIKPEFTPLPQLEGDNSFVTAMSSLIAEAWDVSTRRLEDKKTEIKNGVTMDRKYRIKRRGEMGKRDREWSLELAEDKFEKVKGRIQEVANFVKSEFDLEVQLPF